MPNVPNLLKRAGMAMIMAGALAVVAGVTLRLPHQGPSAQAAISSHAMAGHGANHPAAQPAAVAANEIVIEHFSFGPPNLTVAAGSKVVWTNHDDDPHTIVGEDSANPFKSPPLDTDESFAFTFDKPGTYRYFCSIHPRMQGTIVVQ